ncbi:MAG: hypothetical protein MJZ37_07715 [Bacilli bacterium]|nr:hypothetical protein [Bacilli bacterium]
MKFYVIEISEGDAKIKGKSIYEYDNLNEAIAMYHQKMASAMKSDLFTSEQILVINSENGVHVSDKYLNEKFINVDEVIVDEEVTE